MIKSEKVHVFGLEEIDSCSYEEYSLLFNKDFNIDDFLYKNKNNNKFKKYIVKITGIALFLASNPKHILAFSKANTSMGSDLYSKAKSFSIVGVLIITALRLFFEFSRGGSKYRTFEIIKECVLIILAIIILPGIPNILETFLDKHIDLNLKL